MGFKNHTVIAECRRCLRAATPLIAAQLVQTSHGLVDAMVAARLGRAEFAAAGLAASLWFFASLLCIGLLAGLSPLAAELIGQKKRAAVGSLFRQGLWLGLILGCSACAILLVGMSTLHLWRLDPELIPLIRAHAFTASWGLIAVAIVIACRNICEATQITRIVFVVTVLGLIVNLLGNLGLGLGWFGLPRLELVGIGISTSLVSFCMMVALLLAMRSKSFARYKLFEEFAWPQAIVFKRLLTLSVPIFFALLFEAGLFGATIVQMGTLGTLPTAAHTLAISATSFCYMFPLGLSFALTARIGQIYGTLGNSTRHQNAQLQFAGLQLRLLAGCILTVVFALATSLFLLIFRDVITGLYTQDQELRIFASRLLLFAAIFQFSDGAQATLIGMLRGLQDARIPMLINAFSYWAIAFGIGAYLAHRAGWGAVGLWTGLICGLTLSAALLGIRLISVTSHKAKQKSMAGCTEPT